MKEMKYTWWKGDQFMLGFWNDYPDYMTQGTNKEELIENLKSLLADIESEKIPYIRHTESLMIA